MADDPNTPIRDWKRKEANRKVAADFLRSLATLIEKEAVTAFDLSWSDEVLKPKGICAMAASAMTNPLEAEFMAEVQKYRDELASKISVHDMIEDLKDHEPCSDEAKDSCMLCSTKLS
jgi:hypothetical protein